MSDVLSDYDVTVFDGEDLGVTELASTRPDALIIDLRLRPGTDQLSGWDFVVLLRSHERLANVPLIVCSADRQQLTEREQQLAAMPQTYVLPKPFALEDLEALVARATATPPEAPLPPPPPRSVAGLRSSDVDDAVPG